MENYDIQVGDKVSYINPNDKYDKNGQEIEPEIQTDIITEIRTRSLLITKARNKHIKILKIERPKYEVIEENEEDEQKELLTEEEKELLKQYVKWIESLNNGEIICVYRSYSDIVVNLKTQLDYTIDVGARFEKMENFKDYTLQELGLEE